MEKKEGCDKDKQDKDAQVEGEVLEDKEDVGILGDEGELQRFKGLHEQHVEPGEHPRPPGSEDGLQRNNFFLQSQEVRVPEEEGTRQQRHQQNPHQSLP